MATIGHISAFDGLTVTNGKRSTVTQKALNGVGSTSTVVDRFKTLPNGTVVNYDGTSDADTSVGKATQKVRVSADVLTYYDNVIAKKGNRGTVTKTKYDTGTETCTGVLMDVRIMPLFLPEKDIMFIELDFQFETEWT